MDELRDKERQAAGGLTPEEQEEVRRQLGREPNEVEWALFSVLWSEHCSYKTSKPLLRGLPRQGKGVLAGAGEENAGVLELGDGWAVVFKIESHNHPSAVEPFQGAATGVGGIIRDILAMGARPIALMDSLRVGELRGDSKEAQRNRRLLEGIVAGIAHYGNLVGIPTVGGELACHPSYGRNPLVNVLCVGVVPTDRLVRSRASGLGNPVYYAGAPTGRDGLGGAAFASRQLSGGRAADLPSVQVGDPFVGKLLVEACLELVWNTESVVAMQDMGAAGLACAAAEMAARGGVGVELFLDRVPLRQPGLEPWEILLSESQERMLLVVRQGREEEVERVFSRWGLRAVCVGRVVPDPVLRVWYKGTICVSVPPRALTDGVPLRDPASMEYQWTRNKRTLSLASSEIFPEPSDYHSACLRLLSHPEASAKRWIFEQYDWMVGLALAGQPGADAAILRIPVGQGRWRWVAVTCDGNGRYCKVDPREGAKATVAEALRNLAMVGAVPLGITDNLNLGDPDRGASYWELVQVIEGMGEACRFFRVPVTGGNVSLYNETEAGPIVPTPVIGAVGEIPFPQRIPKAGLGRPGDYVVLLGGWGEGLGGSLFAQEFHGDLGGALPPVDLEKEKKLHELVRDLLWKGLLQGVHDLSDGGLWVSLVEGCLRASPRVGARIRIPLSAGPLHQVLFNEAGARALAGVGRKDLPRVEEEASRAGVSFWILGELAGEEQIVVTREDGNSVTWTLEELEEAWEGGLPLCMEKKAEEGEKREGGDQA
ncbi:phosphoribosylformylglycinamidine synthase subunit PurL [Candidatus Methylacidithermus pantelleriae]|uniref:Phosphoribosylformylglycinamidine synthase subunit PurL n=1 Tax=Candidatus Methylacidithermus pantelleriae TaxID=2744239 RepID=A0A8J2BGB3_9BACT|nr:phosphoribosylformylglycinamidine synthase subunit PurL [Candidatus Methylacidithermus pantelleriae]CAF0689945.1 Phosphoribosylformylglycinamidine synthase subunit PurL [Candidatus Methylacidithermus pantelleriae]